MHVAQLSPVIDFERKTFGTPVSPPTRTRWIKRGVKGTKLWAMKVRGQWHTSPAAWRDFLEARRLQEVG